MGVQDLLFSIEELKYYLHLEKNYSDSEEGERQKAASHSASKRKN
jgi:hypothetical protein